MNIPSTPRNKNEINPQIIGLAFDGKDGHNRVTKGENFQLHGGSEETHERMVEISIKVNEKLAKKGKTLKSVSINELKDIFHDASDI